MQLVEQFSWAGRKYLVYERRERAPVRKSNGANVEETVRPGAD
jgi:hypothetical protein